MYVDMLCSVLESEFGNVDTVPTPIFSTTNLKHKYFLLELEIDDQTIKIHNILVYKRRRGYGSAIVSLICDLAQDEDLQVMACNVTTTAEAWWYEQGFVRIAERDDFIYTEHDPIDENLLFDELEVLQPEELGLHPPLWDEDDSLFDNGQRIGTYTY